MSTSSTTTLSREPWWRTAPNPPCVSWCEVQHQGTEFTNGGGFLCRRTIRNCDEFAVEAQAYTSIADAHVPGSYTEPTGTVYLHVAIDTEAMPPAEARRLTVEIAVAAAEAAAVAERAVQA